MSLSLLGLMIAAKFAVYWGSLTGAGVILVRLVVPSLISLDKDLKRLVLIAAIAGLVGTVLGLMGQGAVLSGRVLGLFDPFIFKLMFQTPAGGAVGLRCLGFALLIAAIVLPRFCWGLGAFGAGMALLALLRSGHIPSLGQSGLTIALFLHLLGLTAWIGVIPALRLLAVDPSTQAEAADLGHRFGRVALVFIPVLLLAGGVMAWYLLGQISRLITTPYGLIFMVKVACVIGLLLLGLQNRQRHVPGLRLGDPAARQNLLRVLRLEGAVILMILLVTAVLTTSLSPPA